MRIQNNITAMNTHRMYTINNDNVAKSAEKLSSGYRINRAGDDAAGLAISEKMRAQIRGLNMATKNSQDAISLVQTAEGALQETHSMLQRMNELAVQAATGTNEGFDRTQAAKEFEQLKREINDVAEQTNFNNMKILDGSISYEGYQRSWQTSGVSNTVADNGKTAGAGGAMSSQMIQDAVDQVASAAAKDGFMGIDLSGITVKAGESASLKLTDENGKTYEFNFGTLDAANDVDLGTSAGLGKLIAAADASNPTTLEADANGKQPGITLAVGTGAAATGNVPNTQLSLKIAKEQEAVNVDLSKWKVSIDVGHGNQAVDAKKLNVTQANINETAGKKGQMLITVDTASMKVGDTFTVGADTYKVYDAADGKTNGATDGSFKVVNWNGQTDSTSDLVANMTAAITANASTATQIGSSMIQVEASAVGTAKAKDELTFSMGSAGSGDYDGRMNTIEFEVSKMKDGDKFTIKSSGSDQDIEVTYKEGTSRKDFMDEVAAAAKEAGWGEVKGNALIVKDAKVDIDFDWNESINAGTNAMRIQVGANENEQLALSIDSMNTKGLGLDDAFLTIAGQTTDQNIDSSGAAITAVKAAINKVSDQRATLGAMQNRLDHKIANLKVSSENLSAAESRIRDVDMASEMTNFTKNNILSQAATAMLAQANALPQNVLSLLG